MSDQVTLSGFEAPHEKERTAYQEILPALRAAASEAGADPEAVKIRHGRSYSSVWYGSILAFRMKLRGDAGYVEVPLDSRGTAGGLGPLDGQKEASGGFWRVKLGAEPLREHGDILADVLRDAIGRLPKEWDCCSRYRQCSDARRCVHPDQAFALKCRYRKILASGRIYYGENRNVN